MHLVATFALLTDGIDKFIEAYQEGVFDKLYATNLSYVPDTIKNNNWYYEVDCSKQIAEIIDTLNKKKSLTILHNGKKEIINKVRKKLGGNL